MTETARALNAEEVIELIRSHIAAYLDGGPNRKAENIELGRMAGLDTEPISALWDEAERQMVKVDLPPLEVVVLPPQEAAEQPSASTVAKEEERPAASKAAEVVKVADVDSSTGWGKRRKLGEGPLLERLVKKVLEKEAEAFFKNPEAQPRVEGAKPSQLSSRRRNRRQ
jgi:hypothetical protein